MRNSRWLVVCLTLVDAIAVHQARCPAATSPASQYCSHVLQMIHRSHGQVSIITAAAERVADKLVAGGNLYVAGSDRGFNLEALGRAGGMMVTRLLPNPDQVNAGDVVLLSFTAQNTEADRELAGRLSGRGAMVLGFGSPQHAGKDSKVAYLFDNHTRADDRVLAIPGYDERMCPTSAVGNAINLWTFTAELVAACTRRGKMPTLWQSVMVPGSRERNQKYIGKNFHEDLHITAIQSGVLGKMYLDRLAHAIEQIHRKELPALKRAAQEVAETLQKGKGAYIYIIGHMPPDEVGHDGDPKFFKVLPYGKQLAEWEKTVSPDDVVVGLVYTGIWPELLDFVNHTGARAIWIVAPTDDTQKALTRGDLVIDQHWVLGDAIVDVPGYDVKILPPSAVTQLTIYWGLVGEIAKRVTHTVKVAQ